MVSEVLVRMPSGLYERLVERAAAEKRAPDEAIVEAVTRWLEEEPTEVRIRRALERHGLLVPPHERRYATGRQVDRERLKQRLARLRLVPPLSEDIIAERGER